MPNKVLLINPSYFGSYGGTKVSMVTPDFPSLGLAAIAAAAIERGHKVEILDMSWQPYNFETIREKILQYKPDIVGITATTPMMNQLRDMSVLIKDISKNIFIVGGGSHPAALPVESLSESMLDAALVGEADYSFADLCDGYSLSDIPGVYYRNNDEIVFSGTRAPIANLDALPMPAWHLYNINSYKKMSRLLARRVPLTMAEFSRGCVYRCDFCASKITAHLGYRKKSPERCAEEVKYMHKLGWREFFLADDIFTSDQKWATNVADAITNTGVDMVWTTQARVESDDENLFRSLKKAGCYRVAFGLESGNDEVLKGFGKGGRANIAQAVRVIKRARAAGLDTNGYFMVGLSSDSEKSMNDTIEFARKLPLDVMKCSITIPFPGTKMFNNYVEKGLVKSFNWDDYMMYTVKDLFAHTHLKYETIQKYMKRFYNVCLLFNPAFIFRRFIRGIKTGEFFWDFYYAFKFYLLPATGNKVESTYYAKERWPKYDFKAHPPKPANYQIVRKSELRTNDKIRSKNSLEGRI